MSSDHLYEMLSDRQSARIPWDTAAEHFMQMKLASGGLLVDEVDLLKLAEEGKFSKEELEKAIRAGQLSGIRSSVASQIASHMKHKRTSGERILRESGTAGGLGAGYLATQGKSVPAKALGMAAGALLGRGLGKTVGQELDQAKLHKKIKGAEITKESAKAKLAWSIRNLERSGAAEEVINQHQQEAELEQAHDDMANQEAAAAQGMAPEVPMGDPGTDPAIAEQAAPSAKVAMLQIIRRLRKTAEDVNPTALADGEEMSAGMAPGRDEVGDAPATEPVVDVPQDLQPNPMDALLAHIQKANEADFHADRAQQLQGELQTTQERAQMLEGQLQQLLQQFDQTKAETEQQTQMVQQQAQQTAMQAQTHAQDAMAARDESLQAQQQVVALRQSITGYRQQLMDMLAQDPTQAVAPPQVPAGPMAPPAPGTPPGVGAPPPDQAAMMQQQGMPQDQAAMMQQQGVSPDQAGGAPPPEAQAAPPPEAQAAPAAGGGGSSPSQQINIHPPKSGGKAAAK